MPKAGPFHFAIAAVDAVIFAIAEGKLMTLIRPTETETKSYAGMYSLPGAVMRPTEDAEATLARILKDKAGLPSLYNEQLYTFTALDRDVRSRAIAVAYLGCVAPQVVANFQHEVAVWVDVTDTPKLAYDHVNILAVARKRLASKLLYTTIAKTLLPTKFTLTELQSVYEIVRGETLDKRNFRKKIMALGIVTDSGEVQAGMANRPATLYTFTHSDVIEIDPIL